MNQPNFSHLVPSVLEVKATADLHVSDEELKLPQSKSIAELLDEETTKEEENAKSQTAE
jgi:hypothetical protein